ncbi:SOMATIC EMBRYOGENESIS RECEPTOR KINASE 1 [Salix koriyanagi]|uniref:SOMATIC EMBRYOGENESIS RECEPTOR KINASE 1 n=1 Tax=Salix koriyanagi TaxID=2511006 RepID=A0A9Q0ZBK6_9ROSI|nr:SOMATIC EMBRYOGENESIS RECEPTOR KINASE 1 [Salix koriyanagi]
MAAFSFRTFLVIFWVHLTQATDTLLSPKGVNFEVAALMAVKREMRDESGAMNGWDLNSVDPCTWTMIGCSLEGFVISLEMASVGLSGILSPSIGNLTHLRTMLLQNNYISGPIPEEIGKLSELQTLDLSGNQFGGGIPSSLGFLTHLSYLRLSKNNLSGQIPRLVANLTGLSFLDLSFNNLSGPTPKILAKGYSITGNNYLCTSSHAQNCMGISKPVNETVSSERASSHHRWVLSVAIGISSIFVISIMLLVCSVHWYRSRLLFTSYVQQDYEFDIDHLKRFSFRELQIATSNFSPRNILGQGGYGVVYKGCLPNKTFIAVKRLKDPNFNGEVQFQTEVEMIGLALHRNLLSLYGFCMTPDERLLVYPYMPNGSVADRLRGLSHFACSNSTVNSFGQVRTLHGEKRLEVLVDRELKGCFDASELEKAAELALKCTQSHPNLRPKMSEVMKVLEGIVGQSAMEESQGAPNISEVRAYSFSRHYSDVHEESSIIIEAMELSGPR